MTPRERDTLDTILLDVAKANHCKIGGYRVEPILIWIAPGIVSVNTDTVIKSVQLLPTGAQCA